MKIKYQTLAFAMFACGVPAFAASDGALDATTSVATFSATFGASAQNDRKVRVSGLLDAAVTNQTPKLTYDNNAEYIGVRDRFCVTDTTGGTVRLKFSNTTGDNAFWAYTQAGDYHQYYLAVGVGAANPVPMGINGTIDVPSAPLDVDKCGAGNVSKSIHTTPNIPTNKTFTNTLIVTAIPF